MDMDKQISALIVSVYMMALYQGMEQLVFRKFRRYLINPSEEHLSVSKMDLIALVGGFFGCIIAVIISSCSGFNQTFMHISKVNVKNIGESKSIDSLYWFMMITAIV